MLKRPNLLLLLESEDAVHTDSQSKESVPAPYLRVVPAEDLSVLFVLVPPGFSNSKCGE